ncbi:MAG TPA: heme biosynthesis HemY N-terminal domain-containing protein [Hydrogenophaga sp.]
MPGRKQGGAMRSVFWLLGLAALAVSLALLVGGNQALFSLFWPPYRFDISFNFVLFCLVAGFVLGYLALRAVAMLRSLPRQAQRWREQQVERAAVAGVLDALSLQLSGRFVRAQTAAQGALEQLNALPSVPLPRRDQMKALAHLLVAESAQALQTPIERDRHLQAAMNPTWRESYPDVFEGAVLRATRWAIEDRDAEAARAWLNELPQGAARRIQALRLKLRVARLSGATDEALETARLLAKHRAFSGDVAISVVRGLALDALRQAHDLAQLRNVWDRLDAQERAMPELALAAARRANGLRLAHPPASEEDRAAVTSMVQRWLEPVWHRFSDLDASQQRDLVSMVEPGLAELDSAGLARLEQAQRQWPNNAFLQYLAGQACMQRQLWGKAAQLLGQARHSLRDTTMLRRTWCSLALLAQERNDAPAALEAWKRAATLD